jgi:hypothetical protein
MNGEVPGVAEPFRQIGPHVLLAYDFDKLLDVVHDVSFPSKIGVMEYWNDGVLERASKEEGLLFSSIIQYSITPALHYSNILLLQHSTIPAF